MRGKLSLLIEDLDPSPEIPDLVKHQNTQFFEEIECGGPEIAMIRAMIIRALLDLKGPEYITQHPKGRKLRHVNYEKITATQWINEKPEQPYRVYSLHWCLEHLKLDPILAQKRLLRNLSKIGDKLGTADLLSADIITDLLAVKKL